MFTSTKQQILFAIFAIFALFAQVNGAAASAGNVIAGLVIAAIAIVAICAFLGWWSRRGQNSYAPSEDAE